MWYYPTFSGRGNIFTNENHFLSFSLEFWVYNVTVKHSDASALSSCVHDFSCRRWANWVFVLLPWCSNSFKNCFGFGFWFLVFWILQIFRFHRIETKSNSRLWILHFQQLLMISYLMNTTVEILVAINHECNDTNATNELKMKSCSSE